MKIHINGVERDIEAAPDMPLLWAIRDLVGLPGTKFGCQSGQIMTAVALLEQKPDPTDEEIDAAMSGNICRCGTYNRIRQAIYLAARMKRGAA